MGEGQLHLQYYFARDTVFQNENMAGLELIELSAIIF